MMTGERWKSEFLRYLKAGRPAETAARHGAGLPLAMVHAAREADPEFAAEWDAVIEEEEMGDGIVATRTVSPSALESLLWAQCSDEEAAAYFGISVDDLMARIAINHRLKRVYDTARDGGKAALRKAQFDVAMNGDKTMLTWLGKNALDQSDRVENVMTVKHEVDNVELAKRMLLTLAMAGETLPPIDVEMIEDNSGD